MKKIFIFVPMLLFSFLFINKPMVVNAVFEQCTANGGTCRQGDIYGAICNEGETSIGAADCPQDDQGLASYFCCKPGSRTNCKKDRDQCMEPADCCSGKCDYDAVRGLTAYKTCLPTSYDLLPVTPTTKDCNSSKVTCPSGKIYSSVVKKCCTGGGSRSLTNCELPTSVDCGTGYVLNSNKNYCQCIKEGSLVPILQPTACNKVCQELDPNTGGCIKWQGTGIETALGCFPTDTQGIIGWILNFGIGVGGGLAFLRGIWGVILMITSSGNPERLKEAQETLSSSIAGIIIIIFAVFLLRLIGVTILEIPGFG